MATNTVCGNLIWGEGKKIQEKLDGGEGAEKNRTKEVADTVTAEKVGEVGVLDDDGRLARGGVHIREQHTLGPVGAGLGDGIDRRVRQMLAHGGLRLLGAEA